MSHTLDVPKLPTASIMVVLIHIIQIVRSLRMSSFTILEVLIFLRMSQILIGSVAVVRVLDLELDAAGLSLMRFLFIHIVKLSILN